MASSNYDNNRCKLLVLDIDTSELNSDDLRQYFTKFGPIEWIEIFSEEHSAVIYFVSYFIVDHLVNARTCIINQNQLRLRYFRSDEMNWNIDSRTLRIKFRNSTKMNNIKLTESSLFHCLKDYHSYINKITVFPNNHALIFFSDYLYVDRLALVSDNEFQINNQALILERMVQKNRNQQQKPTRDVVIDQLLSQIEYLSKQLREKPENVQSEIERLEAELFVVKNENAQLKSKQNIIQPRRIALIDTSNTCSTERSYNKRWRSNSSERELKRHC